MAPRPVERRLALRPRRRPRARAQHGPPRDLGLRRRAVRGVRQAARARALVAHAGRLPAGPPRGRPHRLRRHLQDLAPLADRDAARRLQRRLPVRVLEQGARARAGTPRPGRRPRLDGLRHGGRDRHPRRRRRRRGHADRDRRRGAHPRRGPRGVGGHHSVRDPVRDRPARGPPVPRRARERRPRRGPRAGHGGGRADPVGRGWNRRRRTGQALAHLTTAREQPTVP